MRLVIALLVCVSTIAHADTDDRLDVPGLDADDLRGNVMIWADARIYLEPHEPWNKDTSVRFSSISKRRTAVGHAIPVHVIDSTLRNFVEIEAGHVPSCTWRRLEVDDRIEGLRLYVHREDLAPVLIKPFTANYTDGTRIKLAVGMPVMPTPSGDYIVPLRDDKIRLPIPHDSVGYVYKPARIADPDMAPSRGEPRLARLDRNVHAGLGDDGFQVRTSNWIGAMPDRKSNPTLFHLEARCIDMVVEVPATALRPAKPMRRYPPRPPRSKPATSWRLPAGTPLSTRTGREVAVAATPISIPMPAPAPETACFDIHLTLSREDQSWGTTRRTLKLCAPGTAIEH